MVKFTQIPATDPRLSPQIKAKFLNVGQIFTWEVTDSSGTYTGMVVVGEKPHPQGFQSFAEIVLDVNKEISIAKARELSDLIQKEISTRAIIKLTKPGSS